MVFPLAIPAIAAGLTILADAIILVAPSVIASVVVTSAFDYYVMSEMRGALNDQSAEIYDIKQEQEYQNQQIATLNAQRIIDNAQITLDNIAMNGKIEAQNEKIEVQNIKIYNNELITQRNTDLITINALNIETLGMYDQLLNQNDINLLEQQNLLINNYERAIPPIQDEIININNQSIPNLQSSIDSQATYDASQYSRIDNTTNNLDNRLSILESLPAYEDPMNEIQLRTILNDTVVTPLTNTIPEKTVELLKPESQLQFDAQTKLLNDNFTKQYEELNTNTFNHFETLNQELNAFTEGVPISTKAILTPELTDINNKLVYTQQNTIDLGVNLSSNTAQQKEQFTLLKNNLTTIDQTIANTNTTNTTNNNENTEKILTAIGLVAVGVTANKEMLINLTATATKFVGETWKKFTDSALLGKAFDLLNLALNFHNAAMLSADLGRSLMYMIENVLSAIGIKDQDGTPIDIASILGTSVENFAKIVLGAENYANAKAEFNALNRIYQAGMNIMYTVGSMIDTSQSMLENVGEYVGKIGNALRRSGEVAENAYKPMQERWDAITQRQSRLKNIAERLEEAQEITDAVGNIAGDVISLKEDYKTLTENRAEMKTAIKSYQTTQTSVGVSEDHISPDSVAILEEDASLNSEAPVDLESARF